MNKAWGNIEEVPFCFARSSVKFQGRTGQKLAKIYSNWAFPDYNEITDKAGHSIRGGALLFFLFFNSLI